MSRLIQIDPEAKLNPEPEGYEFGYHAFEDMEPIKSDIQEIKVSTEKEPITLPQEEIKLPLSDEKLLALQAKDKFCNDISNKLQQGQLQDKNPYYKENEILKRYVEDGKQRFEVVVLPQVLSGAALQLAHEGLGHNGSPRTYALLKRNYFWKGLKPMVKRHVKSCKFCQEHNKQAVKYRQSETIPMELERIQSSKQPVRNSHVDTSSESTLPERGVGAPLFITPIHPENNVKPQKGTSIKGEK